MIKFTPLLLCYLLFLPLESSANTELNALNKQLNEAVELIESRYGISVSYSEQQAMKISLVADKVSNNTASESTETKILNAVSTYEISDEDLQRKLVIEVGTNGTGSGAALEPPM
ncbi:hypothetical protein CJF42_19375 [Pseudoalteromonas sp. NBT06-2]|uniref:hypothetical protein n=1 Tax=Pseudoalteromonas sp. NBT06-2 TaxID=2025950 RepID=UPI000BA6E7C3|nr:hypothetical protein [Pseudoalteromonas sp. NBT06-2]PAJ72766.1 hypothetical protein CJF42_19375 [Pseudoalteromonas sp. NBT06-2]